MDIIFLGCGTIVVTESSVADRSPLLTCVKQYLPIRGIRRYYLQDYGVQVVSDETAEYHSQCAVLDKQQAHDADSFWE